MLFKIKPDGTLVHIYDDEHRGILPGVVGKCERVSDVEPTGDGRWEARMARVSGPTLGPFDTRADALAAEVAWLEEQMLPSVIPWLEGSPVPGGA